MSTVTQLPKTVHPPGDGDREVGGALSELQAYDALSEAADLITKAGRLLRRARQPGLGFHLSDIADEIHTEIRRCHHQPAAPQRPHLARGTAPPDSSSS
jgi:hypothetical protein